MDRFLPGVLMFCSSGSLLIAATDVFKFLDPDLDPIFREFYDAVPHRTNVLVLLDLHVGMPSQSSPSKKSISLHLWIMVSLCMPQTPQNWTAYVISRIVELGWLCPSSFH
jgi:hypothetical protein